MATFTPPVDEAVSPIVDYWGRTPGDADPLAVRLMRHFAPGPRGRNVFIMADGSVTEQQPPTWDPSNPTAPYATVFAYTGETEFTNPANLQVAAVFWGGHTSPVTAAEAAVLTAAGYEVDA